jgi:hypothetical protein
VGSAAKDQNRFISDHEEHRNQPDQDDLPFVLRKLTWGTKSPSRGSGEEGSQKYPRLDFDLQDDLHVGVNLRLGPFQEAIIH